ncbi:MAG: transcriptional regulator GlxA family with amidase domain [Enterobacterales bacterium]|jgi:transcriptional regulator GlxA family with amidase domain
MPSSLFLSYSRALLTGLSLPMEMISSARSIARIRGRRVKWDCLVLAPNYGELESIQLSNGIKILPTHNLKTADEIDDATIFIPPIWGNPDAVIEKNGELTDWLRKIHQQGKQIVATGTGVCLLAHAGILNNKVATTHWYYFDEFEKRYPQVHLQRQHFITQDGSITCTGSINALVDLTLYHIENEFDKEVSQIIEQHYSHEINRTYDKPWFAKGASRHPDESIIEVQQWMKTHYYQNFDLKALSEMANMSSRNFSRRFKSAVGKSVLNYGIDLKVQAAKELLKDTNLSHQDIADQLGYKDNAYFSRQFKQKIKLTPGDYREMVRGKLFNLS